MMSTRMRAFLPLRCPHRTRTGLLMLALLPATVLTFAGGARGQCVVHGDQVSLDGLLIETTQERFHADADFVAMSARLPISERGWFKLEIPALSVYSAGGLGGCTMPERGGGRGESTADARPIYRGKAKIAAGAPVYRRGRWATISKSIELEVEYERGSKRVYLSQIPGLSGAELFAIVPLEFVELPQPLPVGR